MRILILMFIRANDPFVGLAGQLSADVRWAPLHRVGQGHCASTKLCSLQKWRMCHLHCVHSLATAGMPALAQQAQRA